MLKSLLFSLVLCLSFQVQAQLNMSLVDQIEYDIRISDVWGYVAPDGTEYALVGLGDAVSIVSLADPTNAVEVASVPGQFSIWRDIKTWGTYAYVVADQSGSTEGVTVIDLANLPESVEYYHWTPDLPSQGVLQNCHNIYIDEFGYGYITGCNVNGGGVLFLDLFTTPGTPIYVGPGLPTYSHDIFTRENIMYTSEIWGGKMGIYDVSDKSNPFLLGSQTTPLEFTHNVWLSDDNNVAFTTDERDTAPVVAYDVSDPTDIQELDRYQPIFPIGSSSLPHNVHTWQDWLIISYYTDGGKIVDASRPHNLVEVGNFDVFFGLGANSAGVWGAYPYLPSGLVLLTDIGNGLYVLDANYVHACFIEGNVTNASSGATLNEVEVVIDIAAEPNRNFSDLSGDYGTGIATAGEYSITFSKAGFFPFTTTVDLDNGIVVELDVQLQPIVMHTFTGVIIDAESTNAIPNAAIVISNGISTFTGQADANGNFTIPDVFESNYQLIAGAWGYQQLSFDYNLNGGDALTLSLTPGYEDDFALDLGWEAIEDDIARTGLWELGEPVGTNFNNDTSNPEFDIEGDLGDQCYVTGNAGGTGPNDDVDGGVVTLISPSMDFSNVDLNTSAIFMSYNLWFYNDGGSGAPNDELTVSLSNGIETVVVETVSESNGFWRAESTINVTDFLMPTDDVQIHFITSDFDDSGHIVEAAVDGFKVDINMIVNTTISTSVLNWELAPNPFSDQFQMTYDLEKGMKNVQLKVYNAVGQLIQTLDTDNKQTSITMGGNLPKGIYFLHLEANGKQLGIKRVVKQ